MRKPTKSKRCAKPLGWAVPIAIRGNSVVLNAGIILNMVNKLIKVCLLFVVDVLLCCLPSSCAVCGGARTYFVRCAKRTRSTTKK